MHKQIQWYQYLNTIAFCYGQYQASFNAGWLMLIVKKDANGTGSTNNIIGTILLM